MTRIVGLLNVKYPSARCALLSAVDASAPRSILITRTEPLNTRTTITYLVAVMAAASARGARGSRYLRGSLWPLEGLLIPRRRRHGHAAES